LSQAIFYFTDTQGFGGAEQSLLHLIAGLDRQVWAPVLIYHPGPGIAPLLARARQLETALWPVPPMPDGRVGAARLPGFARELMRRRPAVFHAHLTWPLACKFGLMAAILARVPAIVATEQLFVEFRLDASIYLQQRLVALGVGRYLPVSRDLAGRLQQRLHLPTRKLQVIHNGIPAAAFSRPANAGLRGCLARESDRPIVLTVARLDAQKGLGYLLEAAAQVPEAQFVIAGDGPERASLEAQASALGLAKRVDFLGYRSDTADLLAACDLFVLPSLYEGLPLSVLEAMAAGKPVIATAIGGTDEAITPGQTGLLVPPADPAALGGAIRELLAQPALAQRLALAGRARVQDQFSAGRMVAEVTQVYRDLLSRHAPGHAAG
jgi:glycosyltransferase involved in cell wall biosynthesis